METNYTDPELGFGELYGALKTWAKRLADREAELDKREAKLDGQKQAIIEILSSTINHNLNPDQGSV